MNSAVFDSSTLIPAAEQSSCRYLRRTHDIALGRTSELFYCMQYAGHYICRQDFHIRRKLAGSALILLTVSGEGRLYYRGSTSSLTPGTCILIDTRELHEYHSVSENWAFKYLHFEGAMTEDYLALAAEQNRAVFSLDPEESRSIEQALDRILDLSAGNRIEDYPHISGIIYSMLMLLLSHNAQNRSCHAESTNTIYNAARYIRENYRQFIRTEDIAKAANLSRAYMSELFSRTFGISPHEYLLRYRLSMAKTMLLHSALSMTEIAEQTGFRDAASFSRIFRRENGISPTEYRETYTAEEK